MGLFPQAASEYLALIGIPRGPYSNVYIVDPANGSDSNPGTTFQAPLLTLAAAYAKCTTNQNDVVLLVGGPTALNPAAAIAWAKDYTHLIGLSADLPGVGQRCRVVGTAALDLSYLIDFQGDGCIVRNVQFFQGNDAAADSGAVIVSGDRNLFENCFFAGMGHATAAARAGSWSLKLTGAENAFKRCSIGLASMARTAANTELWMTGECNRNKFIDCEFISWSVTAGKFLVKLDASAVPYTLQFENCLFNNLNSNNGASGTALSNAISDAATPMHHIILRGDCPLVGVTGWADTVTYVYGAAPAPAAGYGVSVNPTT
ncbi:MAG: hypothetical protein MUC51_19340 [Anaerolineae bacterium]|jgi:hypothetical protein|nr:hypothetical protein [Anaerolineae bacterium]